MKKLRKICRTVSTVGTAAMAVGAAFNRDMCTFAVSAFLFLSLTDNW